MAKKTKAEKPEDAKVETTTDAEEPATEAEQTKEQKLEAELDDVKDQLLRVRAEYANFRTRSAKEKEQTYSNAKGNVLADILPAIDNLERAIALEGSDYDALKKGVEMTLTGLMATLEKLGVEAFGEAGEEFDPNLHNAVMHIDDDSLGENVITDVFQKGYKISDRVIRPAMVKTAN